MAEPAKILIVEDDTVLKDFLSRQLSGKYAVQYASDGEEAIALFESEQPALVLLDLVLPKLDGFAVLERIRSRPDASKETPVVVLSNLSQESDRDRAMRAGANVYLVKAAVSVEEIVEQIAAFVPPAA